MQSQLQFQTTSTTNPKKKKKVTKLSTRVSWGAPFLTQDRQREYKEHGSPSVSLTFNSTNKIKQKLKNSLLAP